eukprot:2947298-Prymnesium_polylepis.1
MGGAAAAAVAACQQQQQQQQQQKQQQQQQQARVRPAVVCAARSVCCRVHVRAHGPIGTADLPSSPSACCLPAGPGSSVSCSIRHG